MEVFDAEIKNKKKLWTELVGRTYKVTVFELGCNITGVRQRWSLCYARPLAFLEACKSNLLPLLTWLGTSQILEALDPDFGR